MALINITNLTFAYEGSYDNIFEDASFQIDTDWKLGFTGRNGRGKTTFLNLLLGKYEYRGKICSTVNFQYFPYPVSDKTKNTAAIIREIASTRHDWEVVRELSLLDVSEDVLLRPFETLSNGEQTKVLLAALFLSENNFLLIDEPTNHLDINGRAIVSRYLNGKAGYILVSHDRAFLDGCVDHILSINRANIEVQRGNFSSWWENKKRRDEFELAENERLEKEIKRLKKAARQSADWADKVESTKRGKGAVGVENKMGHMAYAAEKSRRMQQRRKNLERRQQSSIDDKSKLLKNIERSDVLKVVQLNYHKHKLISLADVSVSYGEKTVCEKICFSVEQGDRVALQGKNGSGKTSLLKLICGEDISFSGDLSIGAGLKISYVSQDTSNLSGGLADYALQHCIDESLFKTLLHKLDFSRIQFEKDIKDFSGGQKKKVLLARSLCEKAHLLVWDEPLNFIDVLSRMQIENLLLEYAPTILFVEHDKIFCDIISTKRIVL